VRALVLILLVAGCYKVDYTEGKLSCGPGGLCPDTLTCDPFTNLCVGAVIPPPDADTTLPPPDADTTPDADLSPDGMVDCTLVTDMPAWVDPVNGFDDPAHGGMPGVCAFRTLEFALTRATKIINLTPATYSGTFPVELMGTQGLDCDPGATGNRGILTSNAVTGGGLVSFEGTANVLRNCVLDAQNSTGANCMVIYSTGATPHIVNNTEFKNCYNNGIITQTAGTNVNVTNSSFHDNARGIWWIVANTQGVMTNNSFANNSFMDIDCQDASASLTGTGNHNGAGAPACDQCQNCPFGP